MVRSKPFFYLPKICLGLFSVLFLVTAFPVSHAYDLKDYYPLQAGDIRLYYVSGSENGSSFYDLAREPVSMTKIIRGVETFIVGELSGSCWENEFEAMAWDHEGLKVYQIAECEDSIYEVMDPKTPVLMGARQLELGEKKSWITRFGDENVSISMTLEAEEDVTLFPGTPFALTYNNSLRILWESGTETCRSWYVKNIGVVKDECVEADNGMTLTETSQLFSAKVNRSLIGSPLRWWQGEAFSFYLAQISTSGCDMIMDNIVRVNENKALEFWWVKFTLNLQTHPVAWIITDFGQGTAPELNFAFAATCPVAGLDFTQAVHKINIDNVSLDPQLWIRAPFEGHNYRLGFYFSASTLAWELYFID